MLQGFQEWPTLISHTPKQREADLKLTDKLRSIIGIVFVLVVGLKPLLTEFGIHQRLESCVPLSRSKNFTGQDGWNMCSIICSLAKRSPTIDLEANLFLAMSVTRPNQIVVQVSFKQLPHVPGYPRGVRYEHLVVVQEVVKPRRKFITYLASFNQACTLFLS